MKTQTMKRSGLEIPELVLGSFAIGGGTSWQDTTDNDEELVDFLKAAHAEGITAIDTAPVYGMGRSEKIVGKAVKEDRENWYVSTKCSVQWRTTEGTYFYDRDGCSVYKNFTDASLLQDVEDSLRRLDTDYIDMMIVHQTPPLEEIPRVLETMHKLKDKGVIRSIGMSNMWLTDHAVEALKTAVKCGGVDLIQEHASLLYQNALGEFLAICEENDIILQDYSGLEKGALAGKIIDGITGMAGDNRAKYKWFQPEGVEKLNALTRGLQPIAEKYGCTIPVLVLAWLRGQSPVVNLLVGARRIESIRDTMKVLDVTIEPADLQEMSRLAEIANS